MTSTVAYCIASVLVSYTGTFKSLSCLCVCVRSPKKLDNKCENTRHTHRKGRQQIEMNPTKGKKWKQIDAIGVLLRAVLFTTSQMSLKGQYTNNCRHKKLVRQKAGSLFHTIRNHFHGELANFEFLYASVCVRVCRRFWRFFFIRSHVFSLSLSLSSLWQILCVYANFICFLWFLHCANAFTRKAPGAHKSKCVKWIKSITFGRQLLINAHFSLVFMILKNCILISNGCWNYVSYVWLNYIMINLEFWMSNVTCTNVDKLTCMDKLT